MNNWILILLIKSSGIPAPFHVESLYFRTEEKCNYAKTQIYNDFGELKNAGYLVLGRCIKIFKGRDD